MDNKFSFWVKFMRINKNNYILETILLRIFK